MRIWILNPFDELPGDTDIRHRYWTLAETLGEQGHSVTWWSSDFSHRTKNYRNPGAFVSLRPNLPFSLRLIHTSAYTRNVSIARLRNHRQFAHRFLEVARKVIKQNPDAAPQRIIVSLPPLGTADAAFALRKELGGPSSCQVIVDIQDAWPETFTRLLPFGPRFSLGLSRLLFRPFYRASRRAMLGADRISAVSQTYLDIAEGYLAKNKSTHLSYLGIDSNRFLNSTPGGVKPFRIVYLGSLEKSYDLETLMRAIESLAREGESIELHVAGTGSSKGIVEHRARLSRSINFHGVLKSRELLDLLEICHAGAIPTSKESFIALPNKLFDYCAAGLPILSSLDGECRQLLDTKKAGLFYEPGLPRGNRDRQSDSLISVIKSLLHNPDKTAAYGRNARALAEELFDRSKTYPELARFITME